MYEKTFKRTFDVLLSFLGIVVLSPIFLLVSILLFMANSGNIFFVQSRPGRHEKIFNIIKFRTMNNRKDANGKLLPDRERLTSIGRLVRATSMDEIPQLLNVLKGDMSLIGPRPLLVEYLPLYNSIQKRRHLVRPGITGWAQTNGRNALSWEQKFALDTWYVDNLGFGLDIKILFLTIKKVFISEGITAAGEATTTAFAGNSVNLDQVNIYGGSGHAKVVYEAIESIAEKKVGYIFDDNPLLESLLDRPVLSPRFSERLKSYPTVIAIGNNVIRKKLAESLDVSFSNYISHNSAIISPTSKIGEGTVIFANAVVNSSAEIGEHCILNSGSIVEHDCILEDFVHISPKAALAGGVKIGEGTQIGMGAMVIQGVKIGKWCTIGAGAVIIKDIPSYVTVVGNPGRIIKQGPKVEERPQEIPLSYVGAL